MCFVSRNDNAEVSQAIGLGERWYTSPLSSTRPSATASCSSEARDCSVRTTGAVSTRSVVTASSTGSRREEVSGVAGADCDGLPPEDCRSKAFATPCVEVAGCDACVAAGRVCDFSVLPDSDTAAMPTAFAGLVISGDDAPLALPPSRSVRRQRGAGERAASPPRGDAGALAAPGAPIKLAVALDSSTLWDDAGSGDEHGATLPRPCCWERVEDRRRMVRNGGLLGGRSIIRNEEGNCLCTTLGTGGVALQFQVECALESWWGFIWSANF